VRDREGPADPGLRALAFRVPHAAFALNTAAALYGFGDFVPADPRPVIVVPAGSPRPRFRGVRVTTSVVDFEPVLVHGIPCVPPARCVIDLARTLPRPDAQAAIDGAFRAGVCDAEDLAAELSRHRDLRGVVQARELIRYADPGAQCRQESQLRLLIRDAGLPSPTTQLRVLDGFGVVRYVLDLGWEERRVGAEYDGVSHVDHERIRHDRERQNWLAGRGWRMRYFTDRDLYRRPAYIISTLRDALSP
jgi:very-short-patch-repair endonuclease